MLAIFGAVLAQPPSLAWSNSRLVKQCAAPVLVDPDRNVMNGGAPREAVGTVEPILIHLENLRT
jgi:predicted alpha/beta superfamily hydrolase